MSKPMKSNTRREFAKGIVLTSGALAFDQNLLSHVSADESGATDFPNRLDSHVVPSPNESCGLIFERSGVTYLIFKAIQTDDDDREAEGIAVIELDGCCALAIMHPDADLFPQADWPRFFVELDRTAVYEVEKSSWLAALDEKCRHMRPVETHTVKVPLKKVSPAGKVTFTSRTMSVTVPNAAYRVPGEDARHFLFTFSRTTFHCVADELKIDFLKAPLGQVLASLVN